MTISKALAQTILAYTAAGKNAEESISTVFDYMDAHGLAGFKPAVAKYVQRYLTSHQEAAVARAYTAYPLTPEAKAQSLASLPGGTRLEEIVDPSLIGGVRTEYNYHFTDATTAHALTRLKQHLLHP